MVLSPTTRFPALSRRAGVSVLAGLLIFAAGAIGGVVVARSGQQGEARPKLIWGTVELVSGDGRQLVFRPDGEAGGRSYIVAKEYWTDTHALHMGGSPTCLTKGQRAQIAAVRVVGDRAPGMPEDFEVALWVSCPS
jgi:hypothetical protein